MLSKNTPPPQNLRLAELATQEDKYLVIHGIPHSQEQRHMCHRHRTCVEREAKNEQTPHGRSTANPPG